MTDRLATATGTLEAHSTTATGDWACWPRPSPSSLGFGKLWACWDQLSSFWPRSGESRARRDLVSVRLARGQRGHSSPVHADELELIGIRQALSSPTLCKVKSHWCAVGVCWDLASSREASELEARQILVSLRLARSRRVATLRRLADLACGRPATGRVKKKEKEKERRKTKRKKEKKRKYERK